MGNVCIKSKSLNALLQGLPRLSERNTILWESVINIVLVYLNGQQKCIIESYRYDNNGQKWEKKWRILQAFIEKLHLVIEHDPLSLDEYPRYFVSKQTTVFKKDNETDVIQPRMLMHINVKTKYGYVLRIHTAIDEEKQKIIDLCEKWQKLWNLYTKRYGKFLFYSEFEAVKYFIEK